MDVKLDKYINYVVDQLLKDTTIDNEYHFQMIKHPEFKIYVASIYRRDNSIKGVKVDINEHASNLLKFVKHLTNNYGTRPEDMVLIQERYCKRLKKIIEERWVEDQPKYSEAKEYLRDILLDCSLEPSASRDELIDYITYDGEKLFVDNINTGTGHPTLYVQLSVWNELEIMGLSESEIEEICIAMVYDVHGRMVSTATSRRNLSF